MRVKPSFWHRPSLERLLRLEIAFLRFGAGAIVYWQSSSKTAGRRGEESADWRAQNRPSESGTTRNHFALPTTQIGDTCPLPACHEADSLPLFRQGHASRCVDIT